LRPFSSSSNDDALSVLQPDWLRRPAVAPDRGALFCVPASGMHGDVVEPGCGSGKHFCCLLALCLGLLFPAGAFSKTHILRLFYRRFFSGDVFSVT
jgi:hypothetical protein